MTLTAAQARARLLDPNIHPRKNVKGGLVVPVMLRLNAATTLDAIDTALKRAYGEIHYLEPGTGLTGSPLAQRAAHARHHVEAQIVGAEFARDERRWAPGPSNLIRNPHFSDSMSGWANSGGGTGTRVTNQPAGGVGRAAARIVTGGAIGDGIRFHAGATPVKAAGTFRAGALITENAVSAGNMRLNIYEYQPDGTTLVGTTNVGPIDADATWQLMTGNRAGVAAGNILELGIESQGATVHDVFVQAVSLGSTANASPAASGGVTVPGSSPGGPHALGQELQILLRFLDVEFDPVVLYDALEWGFGVSADVDVANGTYQFNLAA